jgi:hypothetical protein
MAARSPNTSKNAGAFLSVVIEKHRDAAVGIPDNAELGAARTCTRACAATSWDETLALGDGQRLPQRADHPARSDRHDQRS